MLGKLIQLVYYGRGAGREKLITFSWHLAQLEPITNWNAVYHTFDLSKIHQIAVNIVEYFNAGLREWLLSDQKCVFQLIKR